MLEIRSVRSQFVRDNTWVARAYCVVCSVCWFSYRDKSFQSTNSLVWFLWSYSINAPNSKARMQPVPNASELDFQAGIDGRRVNIYLFINLERERERDMGL